MKFLQYARQRARICRAVIGTDPAELFCRIADYLFTVHNIELHPANQAFLDGGRAEVSPSEGCLFYDACLEEAPAEKLMVVVHELGHLELHARLKRRCTAPDPVYGSIYLTNGAPALARYNPRAREEAEAEAFAAEFLCASHEVLRQWRAHPGADSPSLARCFGVPLAVVHAQLAEALYWMTMGVSPAGQPLSPQVVAGDASQRAAAEFTSGPALINAGPGTGKTATLVQRIAYLLKTRGAGPEEFLVLTFSNDAAEELRERIAGQFGEDLAARIAINTFHGFGVTFLHHHGHLLDMAANASILDETGQEELVGDLLGRVTCPRILTLHDPDATVQEIVRHIGYLKDRLYTPEHFIAALHAWQPAPEEQQLWEAAGELLAVFHAYEATKAAHQQVDFADLIALPIRILDAHPALMERYRQKYQWVLVDEYQDVSRSVASLLLRLCGPDNPPWVVGDTRQAIYRFRGAAPENVAQFAQDFPGAQTFTLDTNYRSCAEIVQAANQLAAILETPTAATPRPTAYWTAAAPLSALPAPVITLARAGSDQAEQAGIAAHVAAWLNMGVPASDIAVLARRNIDVRNIVLTLGRHGIRAITTGLATAEGAAGDLAVIATLADQPRVSLPRLAYALGRGRCTTQTINAVIAQVLETHEQPETCIGLAESAGAPLAAEMRQVCAALHERRFSADAFTMMCTFLFDASAYLRRLLEQPAGAEQGLALSEILTSLAQAAGYRCVHPEARPQVSRRGFGQYFRRALSAGSPSLLPPKWTAEAVRVMTCHAAKGLEFPCAIVAGQTLSQAMHGYKWLPPALKPLAEDETQQADAVFFVGVTRAQRALVVTYATSASGTTRSRARQVTPLLSRWQTTHALHTVELPMQPATRPQITIEAIWGGTCGDTPASRTLDPQACAIRTYLEQYLSLRFPTNVRPLYPTFLAVLRRVMGHIVRLAHERGTPISPAEAEDLLQHEWPTHDTADHPHHLLYFNQACVYVIRFACAYIPHPKAREHVDLMHNGAAEMPLHPDLLAQYLAEDGALVAIALRPESLMDKCRPQGLLWSGLRPAQRAPFVLLKQRAAQCHPYVFSAEDGALYPYLWPRSAADWAQEAERLTTHLQALSQRVFTTTVQEWTCDRCPVRLACPYWIGALLPES